MSLLARLLRGALIALLLTAAVVAQQRTDTPRTFTAADYARAEKFMPYNTTPLVLRSGIRPAWLTDGQDQ